MDHAVCLEVGGSGRQVVVLDGDRWRLGSDVDLDGDVLVAVPGDISGGRIVRAVNFGWKDADPRQVLGLARPPRLLMNDAEAAALGEAVQLGAGNPLPLLFVGLGTGIGAAVVSSEGRVTSGLLAHEGGDGDRRCRCGLTGCLETVVSSEALPADCTPEHLAAAAAELARAIRGLRDAPDTVVLAGGIARRNPPLGHLLERWLDGSRVLATSAPTPLKSASSWGLRWRAAHA